MTSASRSRAALVGAVFSLGLLGPVQANDALWAKLAEGGKVVLMRHASVVEGRDGGNSLLRDPSCKGERKLSDKGRSEASPGRRA